MKLINKIIELFIISVILFSCAPPSGQRDFPQHFPLSKKENFYVDPLVFYEADSLKERLDIYIEIPFENIIFKKNIYSEKYESVISLNISLTNANNEKIISEIYLDSSSYTNEEMIKKSKESKYYFYNFYIEPGNYKTVITVNNNNSKDELKESIDLSVKDFKSKEIIFSDIMILSKYKINENGTKEITPLINRNIFGLKEFFMFFEIYNKTENDVTKEYIYKIKDNKDVIIKEGILKYFLAPGKNQKVENIFVLKELKKYLPEEPDFDFFLYDNEKNIYFILDIIDKSNSEIVASKRLNFIPEKTKFSFNRKPPMR